MVIKGNGAVNTMEAVKINTKENGIFTYMIIKNRLTMLAY